MNCLLEISYSGVCYSGFQIQKNAPTVAGELTRAANLLFGVPCKVTGCSRTDAGVHARQFFASVKAQDGANAVPYEKIPAALNCMLPYDISVLSAKPVREDFNPRFDIKYKEYEYIIYNSSLKNPFIHGLKLPYARQLDEHFLNEQAQAYVGLHDFSAFMATGSDAVCTVRNVMYSGVRREGDDVIFTVAADGFLYNMVRIMTGTLIYISEGKLAPDSIPGIISSKNRTEAGITVPPDGLYLTKAVLRYDE